MSVQQIGQYKKAVGQQNLKGAYITTKDYFIPWHASDANELYELAKIQKLVHFVENPQTKILLGSATCCPISPVMPEDMRTTLTGSTSLIWRNSRSKGFLKAAASGRNWLLDWSSAKVRSSEGACLPHAFEEHGVEQVIIRYLERNERSASVAQKRGFTEAEIFTDLNKYTGKEEQFGISVLQKQTGERVQNSSSSRYFVCCF